MKARRLPLILGMIAFIAALLLLGPIGFAVGVLRSSSDAQGPTLAAQLLIAVIVLTACALAGFVAYALTRLIQRLLR